MMVEIVKITVIPKVILAGELFGSMKVPKPPKTIGREGGSTATNVGGKICHSKNWPKVEGYETVFYPIGRSEILTAKRRRTEKAVVKISAL